MGRRDVSHLKSRVPLSCLLLIVLPSIIRVYEVGVFPHTRRAGVAVRALISGSALFGASVCTVISVTLLGAGGNRHDRPSRFAERLDGAKGTKLAQ